MRDPIPTVEGNTAWLESFSGAKCAYNNLIPLVGCGEENA